MIIYNTTPDCIVVCVACTEKICASNTKLVINEPVSNITIRANTENSSSSGLKIVKYETISSSKLKPLSISYHNEFCTNVKLTKDVKRITVRKRDYWLYSSVIFSTYNIDENVEQTFDFSSRGDLNRFKLISIISSSVYVSLFSLLFASMIYWTFTNFHWLFIIGLLILGFFLASSIQYLADMCRMFNFDKNKDKLIQLESEQILIYKRKAYFYEIKRVEDS